MEIETQSYITNLLKTNPKIVENNLNYNDKKFNKKKEYYQLKEHIDTFLEKESDDRFFIMPGLRGVGKTTIIYQLFGYLLNEKQIPKNRIYTYNIYFENKCNIQKLSYNYISTIINKIAM